MAICSTVRRIQRLGTEVQDDVSPKRKATSELHWKGVPRRIVHNDSHKSLTMISRADADCTDLVADLSGQGNNNVFEENLGDWIDHWQTQKR